MVEMFNGKPRLLPPPKTVVFTLLAPVPGRARDARGVFFAHVTKLSGGKAGGHSGKHGPTEDFAATKGASCGVWLNFSFDFVADRAFGDVKIVAGLQIDPELRCRPEITPET